MNIYINIKVLRYRVDNLCIWISTLILKFSCIEYDNLCIKIYRLRLKFSCMMELSRYPLDEQTCGMMISSCKYNFRKKTICLIYRKHEDGFWWQPFFINKNQDICHIELIKCISCIYLYIFSNILSLIQNISKKTTWC